MMVVAVLAVIVLLLFLRHGRITAISASAIPLTMAISVFVMSLAGQTFNLMTLGALAIATGLVIDDAVVITENIVRHLHFTPDRTRAIREAVQEIIWPVTTSTLTTVVVFLPLRLLQGEVGQFFAALSITLTITVLVSLVLALTDIPLLAEQYLTREDAEFAASAQTTSRSLPQRIGSTVDTLSARYQKSLESSLRHARLMIIGALVLIVAGVLAQRAASTGFLPDLDEGAFVLDFVTPGGTALAETDRELNIVERILGETPEIS